MTARPRPVVTYRRLHDRTVVELLGRWVSGLDPVLFSRVDVSPHVLAEVGLGALGATRPQFTAQITVEQMLAEEDR